MIESFALKWAKAYKAAMPDHPASEAVLKFGFQLMIGSFLTIAVSFLLSFITGKTPEMALSLFSFAALRVISGGYHFKSAAACTWVTAAAANVMAYADFAPYVVNVVTAIAAVLVSVYAPSKIEKQTRIKPKYFPHMKMLAVVLVCINFAIGSSILAVTWLLQSISLIRR